MKPAPLSNPSLGILFYMTGIFFMSSMDLLAKLVAQDVSIVMAIWARYAGQTAVVMVFFAPNLGSVLRTKYPAMQLLRSALLLMGTSLFFLSLTKLGLAEATAIMDINPVFITLGAALFLGENFGARRAFGVLAALVGALIIIRPGSEVFSPAAFLPLTAATGYAGFVLITRKLGHDEDPRTSLVYAALLGAVIMCAVVPFFWETPSLLTVFFMLLIGVAGALGQYFLIRAVRHAEASAIAPFSYFGLLVAALYGMVIFDEYPDFATYVGSAIIVAAGIYIWHRERQSSR